MSSSQNTQLLIPDRIKVGFQKRDDTYTKMLGYVIYFDQQGKLRKETSWEGWRDKKIKPVEYANEPLEGFVLNRDVGGVRHSYGWDTRIEKVRVYDPRGFEFEIDIPNLLFILKECDCSRGKGLEGKFVYAWNKTSLVLLPVNSQEYQQSRSYTSLQTQGVGARDLIPGATYANKKQESLTYLGRFDYFSVKDGDTSCQDKPEKKYLFWNGAEFVPLTSPKPIAALQSDTPHPDLAELIARFHQGPHGTKPVRLFLKARKRRGPRDKCDWVAYEESPGTFVMCWGMYNLDGVLSQVGTRLRVHLEEDCLWMEGCRELSPRNVYLPGEHLWVELESGAQFRVGYKELIVVTKENE